jgi:hypothetical protein
MSDGKKLIDFKLTASSYVVGNVTDHLFTFLSPVPLSETDFI